MRDYLPNPPAVSTPFFCPLPGPALTGRFTSLPPNWDPTLYKIEEAGSLSIGWIGSDSAGQFTVFDLEDGDYTIQFPDGRFAAAFTIRDANTVDIGTIDAENGDGRAEP